MKRNFLFGIFISFLCSLGYLFYQFHVPPSSSGSPVIVTIPKASHSRSIGTILYKRGLTRNPKAFFWYSKLYGLGPDYKAGAFQLKRNQSVAQLSRSLRDQNGVANLTRVTIPEGYNIREIGNLLDEKGLIDRQDFLHFVQHKAKDTFAKEFPFLTEVPVKTLEGYLYPETYYFSENDGLETIVRNMLKQFESKILPAWHAAEAPKGSPKARFSLHQVLTIGSLIEKEARIPSERPVISSVFYNRLQKKMLLASDPTVVYAMGLDYKDRVYYKNTRVDSPYNTYRYTGFPPSPISTVSKASFEASLKPKNTPYYFFVATQNGAHHFSKTYQEHLRIQRRKKNR